MKELLTHAHCHEDGTIKVNPLLGQVPREESVTASGILASYRGRASVNADGTKNRGYIDYFDNNTNRCIKRCKT